MTIIVLTNCPAKLRGDMTKWMAEINTGVYVGKLSERVREALWQRICENIKSGQATMVFPSDGEQMIDFRVHNTTWEIADFDGVKLMRRPSAESLEKQEKTILKSGFSNASKNRLLSNIQRKSCKNNYLDSFVVLDIETTGLDYMNDQIIEIGAIKVRKGEKKESFSELISISGTLPKNISQLTGITDKMLIQKGKPLSKILPELLNFIEETPIVCHNAAFDINFLQGVLRKNNMPLLKNRIIDTLPLSRKKVDHVKSYKLYDVAAFYGLNTLQQHRALSDCQLTLDIFLRLNHS